NKKRAYEKLIANNKLEMVSSPTMVGMNFGRLYEYMTMYSYVFPHSKISEVWESEKKLMKKIFEKQKFYEIELPKKYNNNIFNELWELLSP
ncbi:hypothetical protein ACFL1H_05980, partial [Nanoarchaeota archaeon]